MGSRFFFIGVMLFLSGAASAASPSFGTFVGVLKHKAIEREQLVKLELISTRENSNDLELIGILTLHFGSFDSGEYTNYHFDRVIYQPLNKNRPLVFEQSDQEVTIVVDSFTSDEIRGKLRSNFSGGDLGSLTLRREEKVTPSLPILRKIGGDYTGQCSGKPWKLRIQTFRSTFDTSRVGNPFSAYEIRGQLADLPTDSKCFLDKTAGYCNKYIFNEGSYNFFKNDLRLGGKSLTLKCSTTLDGIDCGICKFKPDSEPKDKSFSFPKSKPISDVLAPAPSSSPALATKISEIEGGYTGYLHHEYLDAYQPVSLSLITYQAPVSGTATSLRMSAVASLYFGDLSSNEVIAYKFTERAYPNPLLASHFVFKRSENDVDAILQVTSIKDGEIRGNWNSILFGRVGSFTVKKDGLPKLPTGTKTIKELTKFYESSNWDLDLVIQLDKTPPNTDNPFFPLALGGHFYHKDGIVPRIPVGGGSYNFYTGHIAFEMGEKGRIISGERTLDGKFRLQWAPAMTLTPFLKGPTVFRVRPEEEAPL